MILLLRHGEKSLFTAYVVIELIDTNINLIVYVITDEKDVQFEF